MKKIILSILTLSSLGFATSAIADRVVIEGGPIVIERQGDVYVPKGDFSASSEPYYFVLDNSKRVCYRQPQDTFAKIQTGPMAVRLQSGEIVNMYCYSYDPQYFVAPQ